MSRYKRKTQTFDTPHFAKEVKNLTAYSNTVYVFLVVYLDLGDSFFWSYFCDFN